MQFEAFTAAQQLAYLLIKTASEATGDTNTLNHFTDYPEVLETDRVLFEQWTNTWVARTRPLSTGLIYPPALAALLCSHLHTVRIPIPSANVEQDCVYSSSLWIFASLARSPTTGAELAHSYNEFMVGRATYRGPWYVLRVAWVDSPSWIYSFQRGLFGGPSSKTITAIRQSAVRFTLDEIDSFATELAEGLYIAEPLTPQ